MLQPSHPQHLPSIWLERLPAPLRRLAEQKSIFREYAAGEVIKGQGNSDDEIRYVLSGEASLVLRDDNDERISVDVIGPGEIFGEVSFFTGLPWASDAELVAGETCRLLEISAEDFETALREDPDFTINLVKNLARKVMRLDRSIFKSKLKRRALQSLISRRDHVYPEYFMGDYVRRRVAARVEELAKADSPVLICGENGVGKEGVAHSIFRKSHQCKEVFLQVDLLGDRAEGADEGWLAETPEQNQDLTESQHRLFFGSEEPARDGGTKETPGYFELTDGGTLLVRGADQLTPMMQIRLLEAAVTEAFRRQGAVRQQKAKVRLICTTRLPSSEIALERHPLLYGLLEHSIIIPPLRTRRKEIPVLVKRYVSKYSHELRRDEVKLPEETLKTLVNYAWPGNDLELATTMKRAILVSNDGLLRPEDIQFHLKRVEGKGKFNLLRFRTIKQALMSPLFPAILQSAATPFLFIVLAFLFLGPSDPLKNPAALFSWAVGWPILIVGAFVWARFWCSLCPIGTVGNLAKKIISFDRPFPVFLKNHSDFLIAGAVLFIIWMETATDIRESPAGLGILLLVMLGSAIITSVLYERQSWCLYLCGLGGMIGVLAKTALVELRADRNVCISQCGSNECYLGTDTLEGCPFGHAGPRLHSNRLCSLCSSCVKNCPHGAINLNLRVPAREIWELRPPTTGTAFLVIGLIGGLLSEMSSKTDLYIHLTGLLPLPKIAGFTIVFVALLLLVNLMLICAAAISSRVYGDAFQENYSRFGLALLPLTLTSFMAFHLYYFVNLGVQLPILVSHNFDFEILRHLIITVPADLTHLMQRLLIWAGLAWTIVVIYQIGRRQDEKVARALAGLLPHAALAVILTLMLLRAISSFFYAA
ncbi:MAG: sigma 54-interacting transcriptional regulator [Desulfomonile tiedjei]|nr:sigma 54-interacting transcriptional regulator [Desulfomonile tiedjei]